MRWETFTCKECGVSVPKDRLKSRYVPKEWENTCPDCLEERSAFQSRKQILRKMGGSKSLYMLIRAISLEGYRLKREREYRNAPDSIPEDGHWSTPQYSLHKIATRVRIHRHMEELLDAGCTKCGNMWKLKGVCDGPDNDGPYYCTYCRNCNSSFTLDEAREVTCIG